MVEINYSGVIFLSVLLVLAIIISIVKKNINKNKAGKSVAKPSEASVAATAWSGDGENNMIKTADINWIIAAMAAYLEEESHVSAMAWTHSASEKQEPWVTFPRVQKRLRIA
ncbi:MAG: hypothetical protein FWF38_07590, partial [Spirochaetaceae bacterium]|nr:hypothetical protein [Spirochaetaceae bacterium]